MGQVIDAENLIAEHSDSLRIAYAQARLELGDDPVFIVHDQEGQTALIAYERDVALSLVPEDVRSIIEVPADPGCIWVLVHTATAVTAAQLIVDTTLEPE